MTNANDHFGSGNGSENFYQNPLSPFIYNDGVKDMADNCGAYWLVDLVISYQLQKNLRLEPFQVWHLKRVKDDAFQVDATDGNDKQIASQKIPSVTSDTIWLQYGWSMAA